MIPDPFTWYQLPNQTHSHMIVNELEVSRARKESGSNVCVQTPQEILGERGTHTQCILRIAEQHNIKHWEVPWTFPLGPAQDLEKEGLVLQPVKQFFPQRRTKSEKEVANIREGVRLAEIGFEAGYELLRKTSVSEDNFLLYEGKVLTAERLRSAIDVAIIMRGGSPKDTIVAPGTQGADPHCRGFGPIAAGVPIVIDIFPRVEKNGYYGDFTRTLVAGRRPELHVQNAYNAVLEAQEAALHHATADIAANVLHETANEHLKSKGYETNLNGHPSGFFHGLGHGLGLDLHETPSVSPRNTTKLEAGDVVTIEPGLYYPDWGGIRLEDVIVLQENGCTNLTKAPKELFVTG
jgi:Xaa-Pro aminopeptidase